MSAHGPEVELLEELVRTESLSGQEGAVAELLVERMAELGFDAHVDGAGNAVGVRSGPQVGGAAPRELVLLGHMDTVPGRIPVRIEDGKLYGRGSVDAKGPLATFVLAAARARLAPGVTLTVVGAVEEESATSKGARFIAQRPAPEACLIGEPSGWDALTLGYKGRCLVDLHAAQDGGHSAGPTGAVAERATAFWRVVQEECAHFNAGRERLFDQLLPSLRSIRTSSDGLTDEVRATVGFRLPPGFDAEGFLARLRGRADDVDLSVRGLEPAWSSPRTSPLARAFGRVLTRHGGRPRFKHKTGTSDMNVLGPVWGCPIAAYGPGDSLLDHRPDEHIVIEEYLRGVGVLGEVLREAGYAGHEIPGP